MFEGKSRNVWKLGGGAHVDVLRSFAIAQDDTTGGALAVLSSRTERSAVKDLENIKGDVSTWMHSDPSLRSG